MTNLTNETIGNYHVVKELGEGGMGTVCLAQHPIIGRKVAIKLLHPTLAAHPDVVARFFNEARAIHTIGHENVVEILDFGQTDHGQPYFIMEFLEGEPLSDAIARGPMDPDQVVLIAEQVCRALGAAHSKGIVHRDLKPQNVQLVTKPGGALQVKVLDFGVAKILDAGDKPQAAKTRTGFVMGTPLYMSPEQCRGAGTVDARADVYALGVVLFEMLSGRTPFAAEGIGELLALHMFRPPPQLHEQLPRIPRHLAAAVMRALAKEPGDRFQSMDEFRDALTGELELVESGSTRASTTRPGEALDARPRANRWRIPALVGVLAIAAAAGLEVAPRSQKGVALAAPAPSPSTLAVAKVPATIIAPPAPQPERQAAAPLALAGGGSGPKAGKRGRSRVRRVSRVVDEDGLATPSFDLTGK